MFDIKRKVARLGVRAGVLAGATAAVLAVGGVGASGASAAPTCNGESIHGEGSTLQKTAQSLWTSGNGGTIVGGKGFNGRTEAEGACPGNVNPITNVNYLPTGSGAALTAWGAAGDVFNEKATNGEDDNFIGTDDAPNKTQLMNIKTSIDNAAGAGQEQLVIPVTQTAIAIVARPSTVGCVTQLTNAQLEGVFRGTIVNWHELNAGCASASITRVVREDGSGTSYQLKHYLNMFNAGAANVPCVGLGGGVTWEALQSNTKVGSVLPNTAWPENNEVEVGCAGLTEVKRANGGGALVEKVNSTPDSIGYAALPDAEKGFTPENKVILNLQATAAPTFASPAAATERTANCGSTATTYNKPRNLAIAQEAVPWWTEAEAIEESEIPPVETAGQPERDWSQVYGSKLNPGAGIYPICTLTWDVATRHSTGVFGEKGKTVMDYLTYVLNKGQEDIVHEWYAAMPPSVLAAAKEAVSFINN